MQHFIRQPAALHASGTVLSVSSKFGDLKRRAIMPSVFEFSTTTLLVIFVAIAMVIPAVVLYLDDDQQHHLH